jgi:hypothetical protein
MTRRQQDAIHAPRHAVVAACIYQLVVPAPIILGECCRNSATFLAFQLSSSLPRRIVTTRRTQVLPRRRRRLVNDLGTRNGQLIDGSVPSSAPFRPVYSPRI